MYKYKAKTYSDWSQSVEEFEVRSNENAPFNGWVYNCEIFSSFESFMLAKETGYPIVCCSKQQIYLDHAPQILNIFKELQFNINSKLFVCFIATFFLFPHFHINKNKTSLQYYLQLSFNQSVYAETITNNKSLFFEKLTNLLVRGDSVKNRNKDLESQLDKVTTQLKKATSTLKLLTTKIDAATIKLENIVKRKYDRLNQIHKMTLNVDSSLQTYIGIFYKWNDIFNRSMYPKSYSNSISLRYKYYNNSNVFNLGVSGQFVRNKFLPSEFDSDISYSRRLLQFQKRYNLQKPRPTLDSFVNLLDQNDLLDEEIAKQKKDLFHLGFGFKFIKGTHPNYHATIVMDSDLKSLSLTLGSSRTSVKREARVYPPLVILPFFYFKINFIGFNF